MLTREISLISLTNNDCNSLLYRDEIEFTLVVESRFFFLSLSWEMKGECRLMICTLLFLFSSAFSSSSLLRFSLLAVVVDVLLLFYRIKVENIFILVYHRVIFFTFNNEKSVSRAQENDTHLST